MTIRLLYFANLREAIGSGIEVIDMPAGVADVAALRNFLASRGDSWQVLTQTQNLRAAVNQRLAGPETLIVDGDEIAFFPPLTGG